MDEQNTILKTARAKDKSIRKEDVDVECFRKNVQVKRKKRCQNSLVAPHKSHTYQVDVLFMPKKI